MEQEQIPVYSFNPRPGDGCDDCAWLTEAYETPTVCGECEEEQREEMWNALNERMTLA
jgi:hypothetical protein